MRLAGREGEMDRQAIGVHDRVNLAGQAPRERPISLVIRRLGRSRRLNWETVRAAHVNQRDTFGLLWALFKPRSDVTWNGAAVSQAGRQCHRRFRG